MRNPPALAMTEVVPRSATGAVLMSKNTSTSSCCNSASSRVMVGDRRRASFTTDRLMFESGRMRIAVIALVAAGGTVIISDAISSGNNVYARDVRRNPPDTRWENVTERAAAVWTAGRQ
jgi:hypothetical protein